MWDCGRRRGTLRCRVSQTSPQHGGLVCPPHLKLGAMNHVAKLTGVDHLFSCICRIKPAKISVCRERSCASSRITTWYLNNTIAVKSMIERMIRRDRKSDVSGKSVSVRVDLGGRRIIKKKKKKRN